MTKSLVSGTATVTSLHSRGLWRVCVLQSSRFGSSSILQAPDYEAPAQIPAAAEAWTLTKTTLNVNLNNAAVGRIMDIVDAGINRVQLRVAMSVDTFSNFNGTSAHSSMHAPPHADELLSLQVRFALRTARTCSSSTVARRQRRARCRCCG